jgi:NTE family protein
MPIPVTGLAPEAAADEGPAEGAGLSLSGGGYRAMLFHLGALWRLNELGFLPKLERVSSVSGGSITAAQLGMAWGRLEFDASGVGRKFVEEIIQPIRHLASTTIDVPAVLLGWLGLNTTYFYRRHLYGGATLQDLPDRPRFVINASNVQSGVLWRFSKPYIWDYRVGQIKNPRTSLASAVAASSAFPPVLSPVVIRFSPQDFHPGTGDDLQREPFTSRVVLTDGGVYDNLGLETVWKNFRTVLVSDGGMRPSPQERPPSDWLRHLARVIPLIHNQITSLRKRQLIDSYCTSHPELHREGTYWGIASDIGKYPAPGALPCPLDKTLRLAAVATRLCHMESDVQERLINWGYAICDAGMRAHVVKGAPAGQFPYAKAGVG